MHQVVKEVSEKLTVLKGIPSTADFSTLSAHSPSESERIAQEAKNIREVLREASRATVQGDIDIEDSVASGRLYRRAAALYQSVIEQSTTLYLQRQNPLTCEALCGLGVMQYHQGRLSAPILYHSDARKNLIEARDMASRLGKEMAFTGARAEAHLHMLDRH